MGPGGTIADPVRSLPLRVRARQAASWGSVTTMSTNSDDLEPIEPRTAQELYLDYKASQYSEKTVPAHRYRTNHFVENIRV